MPVAEKGPRQHTKKAVRSQVIKMPAILPLQNGDHLSREEFERRYEAMPQVKKAELIEGRVYMPSPVKISHGSTHADIITWLEMYRAMTPGVLLVDNGTVRMDEENEPQPDALLRIESEEVGTSRRSSDDAVITCPPSNCPTSDTAILLLRLFLNKTRFFAGFPLNFLRNLLTEIEELTYPSIMMTDVLSSAILRMLRGKSYEKARIICGGKL